MYESITEAVLSDPWLKHTQRYLFRLLHKNTFSSFCIPSKHILLLTQALKKGVLVTAKLKKMLEVGAHLLTVSRQSLSAWSNAGSGKLPSIFSTILISSSVSKVSKKHTEVIMQELALRDYTICQSSNSEVICVNLFSLCSRAVLWSTSGILIGVIS